MTEVTHGKIADHQRKNAHAVRELHESTAGSGGRASPSPLPGRASPSPPGGGGASL